MDQCSTPVYLQRTGDRPGYASLTFHNFFNFIHITQITICVISQKPKNFNPALHIFTRGHCCNGVLVQPAETKFDPQFSWSRKNALTKTEHRNPWRNSSLMLKEVAILPSWMAVQGRKLFRSWTPPTHLPDVKAWWGESVLCHVGESRHHAAAQGTVEDPHVTGPRPRASYYVKVLNIRGGAEAIVAPNNKELPKLLQVDLMEGTACQVLVPGL